MKIREMKALEKHFCKYFVQSNCVVLHPIADTVDCHIDVLLYLPTDEYPFWKLATMGASDYRMPDIMAYTLGNRNEYVMFVDKNEDLNNAETLNWYCNQLVEVASYPKLYNVCVSYGHSMEWQADDEEMVGAYLEMPQVIKDSRILHCKLGLFKQIVCLQVVLLTRDEMSKLQEIGAEAFSYYLYPLEGESHFLCERKRNLF